MPRTVVVAVDGSVRESTCEVLARLAAEGYRLVLVHGDGSQLQSRPLISPVPLDVSRAESQGQIGYQLQNALEGALVRAGAPRRVACVLTRVLVDPLDPAFREPRCAVGPIYTPTKAMELIRRGFVMHAGLKGWRQVVPAPDPVAVLESPTIRDLLEQGAIVIAAGGGGIPVVRDGQGGVTGVEAIVEKDLTAARLAAELKAGLLVLAAEVPKVQIDASPPLDRLTPGEARRLVAEGCFADDAMAPKLIAAHRFVEATGGRALITTLEQIPEALRGKAGTLIAAGKEAG